MCNLYRLKASSSEVAALFGAVETSSSNAGADIYPGYPGRVVRETSGARIVQSMIRGFPLRLKTMSPSAKPKPVSAQFRPAVLEAEPAKPVEIVETPVPLP
ncbi:hypothetical protein ACX40Y_07300 [Sphingomonas sp. RS6]